MKKKTLSTFFVLLLVAAFMAPPGMSATVDVDGIVGGIGDNYSYEYTYQQDFAKKGEPSRIVDFTLKLENNGNNLNVGFVAPFSIVDNNYGDPEGLNKNGWGEGKKGEPEHTYKNLTGSDKIQITVNGDEFTRDYTSAWDSTRSYNTSLGWNFRATSAYLGNSPVSGTSDHGIWEFEVMYEFLLTDVLDGTEDFTAGLNNSAPSWFEIDGFHISPNKSENPEVPIPAAVFLLGSGLVTILGFRRRSKKV